VETGWTGVSAAALTYEQAGFDDVILETVGVGQTNYEAPMKALLRASPGDMDSCAPQLFESTRRMTRIFTTNLHQYS
jgi:hypothetical protein